LGIDLLRSARAWRCRQQSGADRHRSAIQKISSRNDTIHSEFKVSKFAAIFVFHFKVEFVRR
jgi:hypothetical protein